jgi:L-alanine-DL-glutamate epimerase-like enolase superfamily enzyme
MAAALALYAAHGLARPAALGPQFRATDVLKTPIRIEGGMAWCREDHGLGVEVDEGKLRDFVARSA